MIPLASDRLKAEFIGKGNLSVRSRFWEVIHDPEKGGCITSIRFFNGSNKNILMDPVSSYLGRFSDVLDEKAKMGPTDEDGSVKVRVVGELKDADRRTVSGITYTYTYEYNEGHVKITRKYQLPYESVVDIKEVGIGCMDIIPELNSFAARPSYVGADRPHARCPAKWGEADFDGEVVFEETNVPMYMVVFNPGVEGIEFIPGSDLEEWTKQLTSEEGQGRFQIRGESNPKSVRIVIEPFNSSVRGREGLQLSNEYTFSSYLGLPMIPEKVPRKYMHMAFGNHPWPSDEDIRGWAYSGVNVVRVHNDYHPSGDFWHDGSWPPYDEKGMAELKRVIDTCHKYGIKIIPYFSLYAIHPKSDAFPDNYITWRRTTDEIGSIIECYPPQYYGFWFCLTGWKDFLKGYIQKVVKTLGFDGIYYDQSRYWLCKNKLHSKGDHAPIDDLIDFLKYTRRLVGEEGVILVHTSGWFPCVIVENYIDGDIMFEDNVRWRAVPPLEEFPPNTLHLTFMNVAPKLPVPAVGVDTLNGAWNLCSKCSVLGAFPYWGLRPGAAPVLTLFEIFRAFDLSQFKFKNYTMGYVETSEEAVKGAVYFNEERALVVLANVRDKPVASFKWTVGLKRIGWDPSKKYHVAGSLGEPIRVVKGQDLANKGFEDSLEGFRFKVYYIIKHQADKKYVLYNTRVWNERYVDDRLRVETQGPTGQHATLKFYSPRKPKEIRIDSKPLKENEDWVWNGTTKLGTVSYKYVDTETKVNVQIL